jgi:hypothetical protein
MNRINRFLQVTLLSFSIIVTASSQENSLYLKKGDITPYEGVFLTVETAKKVRQDLIERDGLLKINTSYENSLKLSDLNASLYKEQVGILMNQNKTLMEERSIGNLERAFWTTLGVVGTGTAVYLAAGLARK